MYRLAFPAVMLLLGTACSKYYYVELLDGNWVGTATDGGGVQKPMIAQFTFKEDAERQFAGQVDLDGYIYQVTSANSDKDAATIDLYNVLGRTGTLSNVLVEEETTMNGEYAEVGPDGTPAGNGTFTLTLQ
jgi:hypothetical protein